MKKKKGNRLFSVLLTMVTAVSLLSGCGGKSAEKEDAVWTDSYPNRLSNKDMKSFAKDLKTIYTAADEEAARKQLKTVTEKWSGQYLSAMNRWHDNWDAISPIFKFSKEVRTAFYTTNAIESLNSCYRRLNKQRSVFPSSQALLKSLYLGTFEIIS